jgi:UDP-N-acetylmuramoyl-L-alanyl-D-glutamate--2,6-diaminopimelate ligase
MADAGCRYVFMEASSHSIHQGRLLGTRLTGAVFTNITHDHLDYHGDFNSYLAAKRGLFDMLGPAAFALTNRDDAHAEDLVRGTKARVQDYALTSMADYRGRVLENTLSGLHLHIDGHDLYSRLIGGFNAYNLLAVYAVARELGFDALDITAVVDYAHTPDALENVLKTVAEFRTGTTRVLTVVGCGGDRDRTKRPVMARTAADLSDRVFLTSDNPRSEEPEAILAEMRAGLDPVQARKCISNADRREAIRMAASVAEPGDIVVVAGKGHETYQEIKGVRYPFDDRVEVRNAFADYITPNA